jgi:hypothetical protein
MKTIAIKLPDSLLSAIENAARKRGEKRSALIRQALAWISLGILPDRYGGHGTCRQTQRT